MFTEGGRLSTSVQVRMVGSVLFALLVLILMFVGLSGSSGGKPAVVSRRQSPSFSVDFGDPVAMRIAASSHYTIDTAEGAEEWAKVLPPSGHLVYLPSPSSPSSPSANVTLKPYTVTLFHQLKCLDIIRKQYLLPPPPIEPISKETEHCMNYLRQTVLCRSNLWLESAKNVVGTASRSYDAVCRNWEAVYEATEHNYRELVELGFAEDRVNNQGPRKIERNARRQ